MVLLTILAGDIEVLRFYENYLAVKSGRGRLEVPDSEILRYTLHRAFEADRKTLSKCDYNIMAEAEIPLTRSKR
jgi:hypothetical protein